MVVLPTSPLRRFNSVASATSILLPAGNGTVPVTGGTTIITITAGYQGQVIILEFASASCRVTSSDRGSGGNILLHGPFNSLTSATLTLECDGTNWIEVARSHYRLPTVLVNRVGALAIAIGYNNIPFTAETEDIYGLFAAVNTTVTLTAETAGLWLIKGTATFDTTAGGQRALFFTINGLLYTIGAQPGSALVFETFTGVKIIRLAAAATVILTAYSDVVTNLVPGAGTNAAELEMRWLEP